MPGFFGTVNPFSSHRRRSRRFQRHLNTVPGLQGRDAVHQWNARRDRSGQRQQQARRSRQLRNRSFTRTRPPPRQQSCCSSSSDDSCSSYRGGQTESPADWMFPNQGMEDPGRGRAPPGPLPPNFAHGGIGDAQGLDDDGNFSMAYAASLGRTGLPPRAVDPTREDDDPLMERFFQNPTGRAGMNPYLYQGPYGDAYDGNPFDEDEEDDYDPLDDGGFTFPARNMGGGGGFGGGFGGGGPTFGGGMRPDMGGGPPFGGGFSSGPRRSPGRSSRGPFPSDMHPGMGGGGFRSGGYRVYPGRPGGGPPNGGMSYGRSGGRPRPPFPPHMWM